MTATTLSDDMVDRSIVDLVLFGATAALAVLGLVMVASASVSLSDQLTGEPLFFFQRQSMFLVVGGLSALFCYHLPTRIWETTGFVLLPLAFVLLAIVLVPGVGHTVNGSTRWIVLGPVNLQVSEPARLLFLFYLSGYLVRHGERVRSGLSAFVRPMLVIALACALLLAEPDFGAATVLLAVSLGLMFIGGVRLRYLILLLAGSIAAMGAIAVSSPYRLKRLMSFLNPWDDMYGTGFQLTQSLIAIGRGEWFGVGLGGSVQKLFYLPEAHTDFVFAVLAEELGLIGVLVTVALYGVIVWRAFAIGGRAGRAQLYFQSYLAFGIGLWLGLQAFINMGVNLGLLPTKGLTLPMLSYGGSSLVVTCAAIGLLLRIHRETLIAELSPKQRARLAK